MTEIPAGEIPLSRSLTAVLRRNLNQPHQLQLVSATRGPNLTGPDAQAYAYVLLEGVQIRVPYLRGATIGVEGDACYLLATPDLLLLLGIVKR